MAHAPTDEKETIVHLQFDISGDTVWLSSNGKVPQ
jgi:hypothetical protein